MNQAPPRAQQLLFPELFITPHLGHVIEEEEAVVRVLVRPVACARVVLSGLVYFPGGHLAYTTQNVLITAKMLNIVTHARCCTVQL